MHYTYPQNKQLRKLGVDIANKETWGNYFLENRGAFPHTQGHLFKRTKTYSAVRKEKKAFQWFYGLRAGTMETLASKKVSSPLDAFESRLDVVLNRSGLVPSLAMARRAIREGHVNMTQHGEVTRCTYPGASVESGTRVVLDLDWYYDSCPVPVGRYNAPANRYTDYSLGAVLVKRLPGSGELMYPAVMGVPLKALQARYGG